MNPDVLQVKPAPRKRRKLVLRLMLLSLICSGIAHFVSRPQTLSAVRKLEWLRVREIQVDAPWPLSPEMVKKWLPGLEGENILWVNGTAIVKQLRERSWVQEVTVKKDYPSRVRIEVIAKKAVAIELEKGSPFFVDEEGGRIEKATPLMMSAWDLPVISREREGSEWVERAIIRPPLARKVLIPSPWQTMNAIHVLNRLKNEVNPRYSVSQILLGSYPYFRVFFSRPRLEVLFSVETWESQLPILALLLHSPPRQIGQPQRINLVLPKKAVVSSLLSQ